jgi:hypothetical protein
LRHGLGLEDNTKRDLNVTGWVGVDWIDLAQDSGETRCFKYSDKYLNIMRTICAIA